MRDLVSTVLLARAQEQSDAALGGKWRHEPDSWAVLRVWSPERPRMRTTCLAGDCKRKVRARGYCDMHWQRIVNAGTVERAWPDPRSEMRP